MSSSEENINDRRKRESELISYIRQEQDSEKIKEALDELEELAELKRN